MGKQLLTVRDLSQRWQLSPHTIRKMFLEGTLKGYKMGELRFEASDIERYEKEKYTGGTK